MIRLRLALAGMWLLDAALQFQPFLFTRSFGQLLAASSLGNPAVLAAPATWSARLVEHYPVAFNAAFATVQLLLAVGIAWRRTARAALAASIVWSLAVWWLGEGFGGLFAGTASPVTGAPGAALLYALLAALLLGLVSGGIARAAWLALWLVLASAELWPANRDPGALPGQIGGAGDGEPGWLAATDNRVAALIGFHGPLASTVLAALLALVAVGVYLPARPARAALGLGMMLAAAFWVLGEAFGALLTGQAPDPGTGPLLALLALAYWPSGGKEHLQVFRDPVVGAAADHVGRGG